jgi:hypothetical protein
LSDLLYIYKSFEKNITNIFEFFTQKIQVLIYSELLLPIYLSTCTTSYLFCSENGSRRFLRNFCIYLPNNKEPHPCNYCDELNIHYQETELPPATLFTAKVIKIYHEIRHLSRIQTQTRTAQHTDLTTSEDYMSLENFTIF